MKALIGRIPDKIIEVEFDSPTSVLDLCLKANLIDSKLLRYRSVVHTKNSKSDDFDQLVDDGDRVFICFTYG